MSKNVLNTSCFHLLMDFNDFSSIKALRATQLKCYYGHIQFQQEMVNIEKKNKKKAGKQLPN